MEIVGEYRPLTATTPLGGNVLVPIALTGEEQLSRPFVFTVDFTSSDPGVRAASLLGKPVSVHLNPAVGHARWVHGLVRRFTSLGRSGDASLYRAELVPALWFLTLASDCRTFENKAPLDIIRAICKDAGISALRNKVTAAPPALPYVVQYRETNFDFISRLLEDAGLYYTFEHAESGHTLVFSDAHASSVPAGPAPSVNVDAQAGGDAEQSGIVFTLEREYSVHALGIDLARHDLLEGDTANGAGSQSAGARGRRYDFVESVANDEARHRIEIEEGARDLVRGRSTAALQAGTRVKLVGGPSGTSDAQFHVIDVRHRVESGDLYAGGGLSSSYTNEFVAMPVDTRYRPPRVTPRPSVRGTQTAKIVGASPAGDIDVDAEARVLLEFPWDRGDGHAGKSAHRVHVASGWSGTAWGMVQLPRVGQEVLVEFLEGDPDRPIITARVFNASHKPPYALPDNKTQSGWKSRTVGGGTDNFNEVRFEDKQGSEHVFVQAEKDLQVSVKHDETRTVLHDRITTVTNDDTRTVTEGNDAHVVSKGNQTVEVTEGDQTVTIAKGDQTVAVQTGKQTVTIKADHTMTVEQGNRSVMVKMGNDALEVDTGDLSMNVKLGNVEIKAAAGKTTIEALQGILLKVGPNSIEISPSGITVKGIKVSVEGQAQAELKGAMVTVEGQAMTQVKGAITKVDGTGMVMVKGAITMIN